MFVNDDEVVVAEIETVVVVDVEAVIEVDVVGDVEVVCIPVVDTVDDNGGLVITESHLNSKSHVGDGGVSDNSIQSESTYRS